MAKGAYVGVDGVARKLKGGYVGVDYVARDIKKAYVGVGNVARPFWSLEPIEYYGQTTFAAGRADYAAATIGNYALFAGGGDGGGGSCIPVVEIFDQSLTCLTVQTLLKAAPTQVLSSAVVGDYALFAGGIDDSGAPSDAIYAISPSLTARIAGRLVIPRGFMASTTVSSEIGDIGMFIGGSSSGNGLASYAVVDLINASFTTTAAATTVSRCSMAAASVGDTAIVGGGSSAIDGEYYSARVELIDAYGTATGLGELLVPVMYNSATSNGSTAIFYGGWNSTDQDETRVPPVVYNSSLAQTIIKADVDPAWRCATTTLGDYALFGGGLPSGMADQMRYISYKDLTVSHGEAMSLKRHGLAATTIGNYALFGTGMLPSDGSYTPAVDIYKLM